VRRWLIEHEELPDEPLVAQIPVSVRTSDEAGTFGNRIMLMSAPLFTDNVRVKAPFVPATTLALIESPAPMVIGSWPDSFGYISYHA